MTVPQIRPTGGLPARRNYQPAAYSAETERYPVLLARLGQRPKALFSARYSGSAAANPYSWQQRQTRYTQPKSTTTTVHACSARAEPVMVHHPNQPAVTDLPICYVAQTFATPRHPGYFEQPQKAFPALAPRFASRLIMVLPHAGHAGFSGTVWCTG